jgi:soluble lytic murein transglycosylase-like protein
MPGASGRAMIAWAMGYPWALIESAAKVKGLDPLLVAAFVRQESGGVAGKTRYEKNYRWLCKPEVYAASLGITVDTETIAQMHSYGLIQIMGGTARSLGYNGYLAELVDPLKGLLWGCDFLATLKAKYGDLGKVAAAYNAGSPRLEPDGEYINEAYADAIASNYAALKGNPTPLA